MGDYIFVERKSISIKFCIRELDNQRVLLFQSLSQVQIQPKFENKS